jgi:hypothetical protein
MQAMSAADLNDLRAETRGRIGELYADLTRARRLAELYRGTLLPQTDATAQSALAGYRAGAVDFMTLLDTQMATIRAHQELFRFDAERGKAIAELEMLTATVLVDAASTAPESGDAP